MSHIHGSRVKVMKNLRIIGVSAEVQTGHFPYTKSLPLEPLPNLSSFREVSGH
jgi:hypothetical protein